MNWPNRYALRGLEKKPMVRRGKILGRDESACAVITWKLVSVEIINKDLFCTGNASQHTGKSYLGRGAKTSRCICMYNWMHVLDGEKKSNIIISVPIEIKMIQNHKKEWCLLYSPQAWVFGTGGTSLEPEQLRLREPRRMRQDGNP